MGYTASIGSDGRLSASERTTLLEPPDGDVEIVLDTDTYNEIDDQFALVYALLSDSIDVQAVYAAPFDNERSSDPADGMEKSYDEIIRLLDLLEDPASHDIAYRGATEFMDDIGVADENPATEDLVHRVRKQEDGPLYVVAIGAPTNVSSAIDRAPEIIENMVVVWLGGHPLSWHTADEFNLRQDLHASRVLFDSGVPLVLVPCKNVAEHLRMTVPELEHHLSGQGELSDYLLEIFTEYRQAEDRAVWSKEIWDLAPIAYLLEHDWIPTNVDHSPHLSENLRYSRDTSRHLIRVAKDARRDPIFDDFVRKLANL